jgi:hypothetical protein
VLGFKLNKSMYDLEATTVLLNVYIYLVFVGGWLALVPSHVPHLRRSNLVQYDNMCDKYVE